MLRIPKWHQDHWGYLLEMKKKNRIKEAGFQHHLLATKKKNRIKEEDFQHHLKKMMKKNRFSKEDLVYLQKMKKKKKRQIHKFQNVNILLDNLQKMKEIHNNHKKKLKINQISLLIHQIKVAKKRQKAYPIQI